MKNFLNNFRFAAPVIASVTVVALTSLTVFASPTAGPTGGNVDARFSTLGTGLLGSETFVVASDGTISNPSSASVNIVDPQGLSVTASGAGSAVVGTAISGVGISGFSTSNYGASGWSTSGAGGVFQSQSNNGVFARSYGNPSSSASTNGVYAMGTNYGVYGEGTVAGAKFRYTATGTPPEVLLGTPGAAVDATGVIKNAGLNIAADGTMSNTSTSGLVPGAVNFRDNEGIFNRVDDSDSTYRYAIAGSAFGTGTNTGAGVYGYSEGGYGMSGNSDTNYGVYAHSNTSSAVYANSNSGTGVEAIANGLNDTAVSGLAGANGSTGVAGTGAANGVTGNSTNGLGVYGTSSTGTGVRGVSTSGYGVNGISGTGGSAIGVYGNGHVGVEGISNDVGAYGVWGIAYGTGGSMGVTGTASGTSGWGVFGRASATNSTAVGAQVDAGVTGGTAGSFTNVPTAYSVKLATPSYAVDALGGDVHITNNLLAEGQIYNPGVQPLYLNDGNGFWFGSSVLGTDNALVIGGDGTISNPSTVNSGNVYVNDTMNVNNTLTVSGTNSTMRLQGTGSWTSGSTLNLGDSDYVHIAEPVDDHIDIKSNNFTVNTTGDLYAAGALTVSGHGKAAGGFGSRYTKSGTSVYNIPGNGGSVWSTYQMPSVTCNNSTDILLSCHLSDGNNSSLVTANVSTWGNTCIVYVHNLSSSPYCGNGSSCPSPYPTNAVGVCWNPNG